MIPTFEPTFDIVQYDATIPDGDDDIGLGDVFPILLADPFDNISKPTSNRQKNPSSRVASKLPELQLYSVPKRG